MASRIDNSLFAHLDRSQQTRAFTATATLFFAAAAAAQAFSICDRALAARWAKSWLANLCEFHNANVLTPHCA
jgi:hypothetical protein